MPNNNYKLDYIDSRIVSLLSENSRLPVNKIAQQVELSSPSVAERIRRLEEAGVFRKFTIQVDPQVLGYNLQALVRIRPLPGKLKKVEQALIDMPECIACDKVTGDDCYIARLCLKNIAQLDGILDSILDIADTNTSIIKRSLIENRLPPINKSKP